MHQLKHQVTLEIPFEQVGIKDSFWSEKLKANSEEAIFHQWKRLEESKTIENFRIIQGEKEAFKKLKFRNSHIMFIIESLLRKFTDLNELGI